MSGARLYGRLVISPHYDALSHGYEGFDLLLVNGRRRQDLRKLLEPFNGRTIRVTVEEVASPGNKAEG